MRNYNQHLLSKGPRTRDILITNAELKTSICYQKVPEGFYDTDVAENASRTREILITNAEL